jgi:hypothetical protein
MTTKAAPALILVCLIISCTLHAQNTDTTNNKSNKDVQRMSGVFSLGVRNDYNMFTDAPKSFGAGLGASARMQLLNRLNTEWFADYVQSSLYAGKAHRTDVHIGWNVMFYLIDPKGFKRKFTPFIAAGHCFDYTRIGLNSENSQTKAKASSAVQMSVGCHYNITDHFDISLATLYDLHLGNDVDSELNPDGSVSIREYKGAGFEGHIMVILSAHYKFLRLWTPKKSSHSFWA